MNDSAIPDQNPRPQVSVHVLIYNGSWERVRATLNSVIMQKGIDFEVIVMDDCSKVNHSDKIKDFFSRHNFTNYRLINHEKNLGTVKTCLEAAELSRAEYTRGLGQGDMFFDEYALRDCYNDMIKNNSELQVSKIVLFDALSRPVKLIKLNRRPQNIEAYNNPDSLRESYLLNNDLVPGIVALYERKLFIDYLTEGATAGINVREDLLISAMVFDKKRVSFFDRNSVYYEFGAGFSTSMLSSRKKADKSSLEFRKKFNLDAVIIDKMLLARCEAEQSDFSEKLKAIIMKNSEIRARHQSREALKEKLGILTPPLLLIKHSAEFIRDFLFQRHNRKFIMTETNVSTDFANLCINRE